MADQDQQRLLDFLKKLYDDHDFATEFKRNPSNVMDGNGMNPKQQASIMLAGEHRGDPPKQREAIEHLFRENDLNPVDYQEFIDSLKKDYMIPW